MKKSLTYLIAILIILMIFAICYYRRDPVIFGQEDKNITALIIRAPETCRIGEMVTIDVTSSTADNFEWLVIPETKNFRVITNNQEALFSAESPGTFVFIIAAIRDGSLLPMGKISITVVPGTKPPLVTDFIIKVKDWLPPNADPMILEKLARSFERVASAGHKDVADLVKTTALSNRAILGAQLPQYKTFLVAFSAHLKANLTEATIDDHIELWFSLAAALRSIK